ncbi:helix-turn-helix transcriptional regulator [Escherichia coli]|nr:helix-turn-helix transcriptional regulator [Escherichia coli]EFI3448200.1 helix-turn-helix transcriptional regulator [Escherichia coli]EHM7423031.1 helix-turn-helix transcriptional regulator [Escherichia coli]EIE3187295.1 helix-turn-helix transcriptional regulator [Escherichia coli]EII3461941.1 helix-turn-helix transcriptional regulator [Escherichia coli]
MQQRIEDIFTQAHSVREELSVGEFIQICRGEFLINCDLGIEEKQAAGLKIVAIHQGAMSCCNSAGQNIKVNSPSLILLGSQQNYLLNNQFYGQQTMKYTIIYIHPEWLEMQQISLSDICYQPSSPKLLQLVIPPNILAVIHQLFACPTHSSLRQLYLSAKVSEITALCLHHSLFYATNTEVIDVLRQRDIDSLYMAKNILIQEMESPPSLDELAKRLGINTRKLTQGFRQLFGNSIYGWLQEIRLETAFQLLSMNDVNISTVAYQVGYTPAHFSVAFRKRFGI